MPPLVTHMIAAVRAGGQVDADSVSFDERNGDYLLGATTPDIRVLTRWDRERTHFFDIYNDGHQDCVENFFSTHRMFRDPSNLTTETRAWVAGYLTHVIMDSGVRAADLPAVLRLALGAGRQLPRQSAGSGTAI